MAAAEALYLKALRLRPNHATTHAALGVVLAGQQKLAEAEAVYRQALLRWPDQAVALHNLAVTLELQGRLAEAEQAFSRAHELGVVAKQHQN